MTILGPTLLKISYVVRLLSQYRLSRAGQVVAMRRLGAAALSVLVSVTILSGRAGFAYLALRSDPTVAVLTVYRKARPWAAYGWHRRQ